MERKMSAWSGQLGSTHLDFCLLLDALLYAWVLPKDDNILDNLLISCIFLFLPDISNFLLSFLARGSQRVIKVHCSIKEALENTNECTGE